MNPLPIRVASPGASGQLIAGSGRLIGWSWRETSGVAVAAFQLLDGGLTGSGMLETVSLGAGESTRDWQPLHAMPYYGSVFLNTLSGAFEGVVWLIPCDPNEPLHIPVIATIPATSWPMQG